jgi:hypothetical protein
MKNKEEQKQHLIDMMKSDEELGLYDESREIKVEDIFNDEKRENIKKFIDEIKNPSEPNQSLKDAAERLKGKELFKESNDRARKILSEIKSLPIQERYEKYSERFDNDESAIGNPETWGKRVLTEEDIFNQRDIDAVTDYIGKETSKQETLEEAAREYYKRGQLGFEKASDTERAFLNGAKWQQERSYSKEEVIAFGEFIFKHTLLAHSKGVKNLFEQFKKK